MKKADLRRTEGKSWVARFVRHPATIAAYYMGVVLVAYVADYIEEGLNGDIVLVSAIGVFLFICLNIFISALFFRIGKEEEFDRRVMDVENFISAHQMGWIVNEKYIRVMEFGSKETWVFTFTLENDINTDGEIFQSVKKNLENGSRYVYFILKSAIAHDRIDCFKKIHGSFSDQCSFYVVDDEDFPTHAEVVIYNMDTGTERVAVEWLPSQDMNETNINYYMKIDSEHMRRIIGRGKMLMNKYAPE